MENLRNFTQRSQAAELIIAMLAALHILYSCETMDLASDDLDDTTVVMHFSPYHIESFTRNAGDLNEIASRLNIAVFDNNGNRKKTASQQNDNENFGTVGLSLAEGNYSIVAVAHNGEGTATISTLDKLTFKNNKVTDSFLKTFNLEMTDEPHDPVNVTLERRVAMFRLVLTDSVIPDDARQFKFYYTGGSSTLCPTTGYGNVNSRQTEYRLIEGNIYEVYTFPHEEEGTLKMTVSALNEAGDVIGEAVFEGVPVKVNHITTYTGSFFSAGSAFSVTIGASAAWAGMSDHRF